MANNIKVFARFKPSINIRQELFKHEDQALYIASPKQVQTDAANAFDSRTADHDSKRFLRFSFAHVFGVDSSQKQVFQVAAEDIIEAFLQGYNGTIFAYGPTDAGKTYTIQGPAEGLQDYYCKKGSEDVGLIPRSLSLIFQKIRQHSQHKSITLQISFFEIYRETAYDLLGCFLFNGPSKNKELPKVVMTIGGNGCCHLHGLSCHDVTSEKEAVSLYQWGLANQKAACTTVNQRSSRSHSIFTVALVMQEHGSEIIVSTKLQLVDLAGSDRAWKSNALEQDISGAKFVNLSLYHLETVINALQKFNLRNVETDSKKQTEKCFSRSSSAFLPQTQNRGDARMPRINALLKCASTGQLGRRGKQSPFGVRSGPCYVPYRNSLLTMVLQDSLGGNCNAAMIAALSLEEENLRETILTCRFAQKVARVVNEPRRNEEIDKDMVIKHLQTQLAELHYELISYKAPQQVSITARRDLGHEKECIDAMDSFLAGRINDPVAHGVNTPRKFRTALLHMRQILLESRANACNLGDQGLESADDRDSGLRTGSGSEPTSPLVSEWENDCDCHVQMPPHVSSADVPLRNVTHNSTISPNNDHEEATPIPNRYLPDHLSVPLQPCETGKREASTQTVIQTTFEERKRCRDICTKEKRIQPVEHLISELELQRETPLNKSKRIESGLTEQRARLVIIKKQGVVPEELENEKIAEMKLQKKQRDVKEQLSQVVKKLADLKNSPDQVQESVVHTQKQEARTKGEEPSACVASSSQIKDPARTSKELELKEASTRQKLLACREQMRNLGISLPAMTHGRSCQSPASVSRLRFKNNQASVSAASLVTLRSQGDERKNSCRCSPTPPLDMRRRVVKPPRLRSSMSAHLPQANKTALGSRCSSLQRRFSNPGRVIYRPGQCLASRSEGKHPSLVEYINKSHETLYRNSSFPRRFESSVQVYLRVLSSSSRKMPEKQGTRVKDDKTRFSIVSREGCVQLSEGFVAKVECSTNNFTNVLEKRKACTTTGNKTKLTKDQDSESEYESLRPVSDVETAASEPRKQVHVQDSLSSIFLKKEQRERVKRIREYVKAAEVIQKTWRLYKKHKSESVRECGNSAC